MIFVRFFCVLCVVFLVYRVALNAAGLSYITSFVLSICFNLIQLLYLILSSLLYPSYI